MEDAILKLLRLLPECHADLHGLCNGAKHFGVDNRDLLRAIQELPANHDLQYAGIRKLLSLCLEEFSELFADTSGNWCEVSTPAPPALVYSAAHASGLKFVSASLVCQVVVRGIFLHGQALSLTGLSMRHCGLNVMRRDLVEFLRPKAVLQFGVLCDECAKVCEGSHEAGEIFTLTLPKQSSFEISRNLAAQFISSFSDKLDIRISPEARRLGFSLASRMQKAADELQNMCAQRSLLCGNSLALAQMMQLGLLWSNEGVCALEELCDELRCADAGRNPKRIYCFIVPFLRPEVDRQFRANGVELTGGGAFLRRRAKFGIDLPGAVASWSGSMLIRGSAVSYAEAVADDMRRWGADSYLSIGFAFDRWLGAAEPLCRSVLSNKYGFKTHALSVDFWCENCGVFDTSIPVDSISASISK